MNFTYNVIYLAYLSSRKTEYPICKIKENFTGIGAGNKITVYNLFNPSILEDIMSGQHSHLFVEASKRGGALCRSGDSPASGVVVSPEQP